MTATLRETPEGHHWALRGHRVTQLAVDATSVRLQIWSLQASLEVRLAAPFALRQADGDTRAIDPAASEEVAPLLTLIGRGIDALEVTRRGSLTLAFSDGTTLASQSHRRLEAFHVQGGGALEGLSYVAGTEGRAPWPE